MKNLAKYSLAVFALLCGAISLHADANDPPIRVARLHAVEGNVSIQPADVDQWTQVSNNYPISTGDRIYSDQNSRAEIQMGSLAVRMWQTTDLTVTNLADQLTQLGLAQGSLRVRTFSLNPNEQIEVDTPNGSLMVTQPGDFRVDSYTGDGGTIVTVNSGQLEVSGPSLQQNISAGQSVQLTGTNPIQLASLQMPALDAFDRWSIDRDHHIMNARSTHYVGSGVIGYDDLDDYGSWNSSPDYGPVWYPSSVAGDWAPYRYGHWVWVSPWGWTWVEDEPWGYAPFHYGRWAFIGSRWGWIPGPVVAVPVWSPAFVVFAGGFGYESGVAAWFPLGPGEPFYPWYHCSPTYIRNINVTNINITYIRNTTVINNYNTFINHVDNPRDVHINYANREHAFTAVNSTAFASARPVHQNMVQLRPEQINRAQIIPHPSISPTLQARVPQPVRSVPVSTSRPTLLVQGGREEQARPGAPPRIVPRTIAPSTPPRPVTQPERPVVTGNQPSRPVANGNQPNRPVAEPARPVVAEPNRPAPAEPRQLINRTPAPVPQPKFEQKQQEMQSHPGRPLEPQQIQNMQQGHPAGQMQDREWPAHAAPASRPPQAQPHR